MPRSVIDEKLYGRRALRAKLESLVSDPGSSIKMLQDELAVAGIDISRSGAARWSKRVRRNMATSGGATLAVVIRKVVELDGQQLKALLRSLTPRVPRQKRNKGVAGRAPRRKLGRDATTKQGSA